MNLYDAIGRMGASIRDKAAIRFAGTTISHGDLLDEADRVAAGLLQRGLNSGDRVAILASNCPEYLALYLAAARAGLTFLPLNSQLAPPELEYIFRHAQPAAVFASGAFRTLADDINRRSGVDAPLLSVEPDPNGGAGYRHLARSAPLGESRGGGRDRVIVCYTSGTTGRPKGVAASHAAEIESMRAAAAVRSLTEADRVIVALPLSYIFGLTSAALTSLFAGASISLHGAFDAARALECIERDGISIFIGVPTMYAMMVACLEEGHRRFDLRTWRLAVSGGAPLPAATAASFARLTGLPVGQQYGLSEVRPVFAHPAGCIVKTASAGKPAPGVDVRIVGERGEDLPANSEGDLLVRSPTMMLGYYRDPALTAAVLRDGWLDTGDRAVMDAEGYAWIRGRSREMINRGGAKVSPAEVESVLLLHPDVQEAAVTGMPDPIHGHAVKAVIVPRRGHAVSRAALRRHCRGHLADFKIPSVIAVVEALPLGPTGKIDRHRLAEIGEAP